jgi:hypothetical protein
MANSKTKIVFLVLCQIHFATSTLAQSFSRFPPDALQVLPDANRRKVSVSQFGDSL